MSLTVEQVAEHALMRLVARVAMLFTPLILGTFLTVYLNNVGAQAAKIDALAVSVNRIESDMRALRLEQSVHSAMLCDLYKRSYSVQVCPAAALTRQDGSARIP